MKSTASAVPYKLSFIPHSEWALAHEKSASPPSSLQLEALSFAVSAPIESLP